jgi:Bacterial Ig-like domain (group 3)
MVLGSAVDASLWRFPRWFQEPTGGVMRAQVRRLLAMSVASVTTLAWWPIGAASAMTIPDEIDFGYVTVVSGQRHFWIHELELEPAPGQQVTVSGLPEAPFSIYGENCSSSPAGHPCYIDSQFEPTAAGSYQSTLTLRVCEQSTGSCDTRVITLKGLGYQLAYGTISADPVSSVPGGSVSIHSVTPCPEPSIGVRVLVYRPDDESLIWPPLYVNLDADGAWQMPYTFLPDVVGTYLVESYCYGIYGELQAYDSLPIEVQSAPTATALTASVAGGEYGTPVTFTATVTAEGTPTGTVTFRDGPMQLGTAPVVNSTVQLTSADLSVGTHSLSAAYSGIDQPSIGQLTYRVERAHTTLTAADRVVRGAPTTYRATLTSAGRPVSDVPITFATKNLVGGTITQCTAATNGSGVATCNGRNNVAALLVATYSAAFAGNSSYLVSSATGRFT